MARVQVVEAVRRRLGVVLAVSLGLGALTACTSDDEPAGKPSGLTYLGDEVVDAEKSLADADEMWRRAWPTWDQVVAVPDDSRCWFISDDGALQQQGVCGPFRGLGTPAAEWVQVQFTPEAPETGSVRLVPTGLAPVAPGVVRRSLTLVRADGEEGEWDPEIAQPKGWPRTLPAGPTESGPVRRYGGELVARGRVTVGGFVHTVRVVRPRGVQFADRSTYVPRKRQAFVDFRFVPFDSDRAVEAGLALDQAVRAGEIKLRVSSGGRTWRGVYARPDGDGTATQGQASVVSPPAGFFVLPRWDDPTFTVVVGRQRYPVRLLP